MFELVFSKDAHAGPIYAISGNSSKIYSGGADHLIRRWYLPSGKQDAFNAQHTHSPMALSCIGDKMLAIGYINGENYIIDVDSKAILFDFSLTSDYVVTFHYLRNKNQLLIGTANGIISSLHLDTMNWMYEDQVSVKKIRKMHHTADNKLIFFSSQDGQVGIFDPEHGVLKHSFKGHELGVNGLVIHNNLMLTGGKDGFLRMWDVLTNKLIKEIPAHKGVVYDIIAFEDCWVSASRDKSIKVWKRENLEPIQKLTIHRQSVNALLQQNEHSFVSVSDDKKMAYWSKL